MDYQEYNKRANRFIFIMIILILIAAFISAKLDAVQACECNCLINDKKLEPAKASIPYAPPTQVNTTDTQYIRIVPSAYSILQSKPWTGYPSQGLEKTNSYINFYPGMQLH